MGTAFPQVTFIGFGEAGAAFAAGGDVWPGTRVYDRKTDDPATRELKRLDYARVGVVGHLSAAEALQGCDVAFSLVTAGQALVAAKTAVPLLSEGALWFDCNSVAPHTKRTAAGAIEAAGGRYVDVAIMAPVHPARRRVPLLVSGPHAAAGRHLLTALGFTAARAIAGPVGAASSVKMIRSVIVKGIEALSAEMAMAASAAGVLEDVIASLDASREQTGWMSRTDYNLDRMFVHGQRRADEMEEVVSTLEALDIDPVMTRNTAKLQRSLGMLGLTAPPASPEARLALLTSSLTAKASPQ